MPRVDGPEEHMESKGRASEADQARQLPVRV